MESNDLELCQAAAGGDHAAFHALVDRYAPGLFRLALSLSGGRCDAEDICQETFVAAFRGLRAFNGRSSVKTWLTNILIRRSATQWKKQRHARQTLSLNHEARSDGNCRLNPGGVLADEVSVPSATSTVDQRLDLFEAIRSLAPEFRETLILREVEGMSYKEIAETLGVPCGTVESRLYRGRAELRRKLTGYSEQRDAGAANR